jgi:geranylgeranyl pyrophosphate synthase
MLKSKFDDFYAELKTTLLTNYQDESVRKALEHLDKVIDYNVPHGKKLRGLCTYESYLVLNNEKTDENKAIALGWCIELVYLNDRNIYFWFILFFFLFLSQVTSVVFSC